LPLGPGGRYFPGSPDQSVTTRESDLSRVPLDPVSELSRGDYLAELLSGDGSSRWQIVRRQTVIGSGEGADILLRDHGIAARHFGVRLDEGVWRLQNLGGDCLVVDGFTVDSEVVLAPGSEILAGEASLYFAPTDRWEDSSAAAGAGQTADGTGEPAGHPGYVLDVPSGSGGPSAALLIVGGVLVVAAVVFLLLRAG
jgi:hypothetical protein